jgi:hypothetical protein
MQIKAICNQFRNEKNKIKDWVLYNIEEGFNTFILFDDYSTDESEEILRNTIENCDRDIKLYYQYTDSNQEKTYDSCLSTDEYQNDSSLHARVSRSFLSGFNIFKSICTDSDLNYCAFVDVDEVIVSNKSEKITDIISNIFLEKKLEHLYVQSYDVNTVGLEDDKDVFYKEQTIYRWSDDDRQNFLNGKYKHRGKSIVTNKHSFMCSPIDYWSIIHCGGSIGSCFETAVPYNSNKIPLPNDLRINHYRVPPNDNSTIFSERDIFAHKKFNELKSKI